MELVALMYIALSVFSLLLATGTLIGGFRIVEGEMVGWSFMQIC